MTAGITQSRSRAAEGSGQRAALYLRVSTGRQAEHDLSIPDQRAQTSEGSHDNPCGADILDRGGIPKVDAAELLHELSWVPALGGSALLDDRGRVRGARRLGDR